MEAVLGGIISALVAGAVAKASDVGGRAIADAYDGLKSLIIRRLGKSGAVQSRRGRTAIRVSASTLGQGDGEPQHRQRCGACRQGQ